MPRHQVDTDAMTITWHVLTTRMCFYKETNRRKRRCCT